MKKILLLNLPFENKKLQRDLSCPHTSKADYYWAPVDLVVYSAILSDQNITFIDCVQEKINKEILLNNIDKLNPEFIFTIISSISLESDLEILEKIKKKNNKIKIVLSGDLCSFEHLRIIKNKFVDFVISDITEKEEIRKIVFNKQKKRIIFSSNKTKFTIGIPKHELFIRNNYHMPYSLYTPIATSLTNYGCPFKCKFCNSNNLKFKSREVQEVIKEMKYIEKIGIKEIYFRDLTFGIPHLKELLKKIVQKKIKLKWSCEFRVDLANVEIIRLMKEAGCYLIFYGLESGNQKTLDLMNKGFNIDQIKKAINLTRLHGIETLVSLIIGFESENEEDFRNTKKLIIEIEPDYISTNILVPRIGSKLRKEMNSYEDKRLDSSRESGKRYNGRKSAKDLKKNIESSFFFRPKKIIRYLILSLKTKQRFKILLNSGISIIQRNKI